MISFGGGWPLERKPRFVRWVIICSNKSKGGFKVRNLLMPNKALLCK